jgi:hypothetical protein
LLILRLRLRLDLDLVLITAAFPECRSASTANERASPSRIVRKNTDDVIVSEAVEPRPAGESDVFVMRVASLFGR